MKHLRYSMLVLVLCELYGRSVLAQGKATPAWPDTNTFNLTSIMGGDLFLSGDAFLLHASTIQSLTDAFGLGAELRFRPVFFGAVVGGCGDEGIPNMHAADIQTKNTSFLFLGLYAGAIVGKYKFEIGRTFAGNIGSNPHGTFVNYTSIFLGIGKRFGTDAFIEPQVKISFPIVGCYQRLDQRNNFYGVTEYYHMNDFCIALSLKVGVGFDSYH
jgi:hypothetical protein